MTEQVYPTYQQHLAFQNTLKKAKKYINQQFQEWVIKSQITTTNEENQSSISSTGTPSLMSDFMSSNNDDQEEDTLPSTLIKLDHYHLSSIQTNSPPPSYNKSNQLQQQLNRQSIISNESSTSNPMVQYHTLHGTTVTCPKENPDKIKKRKKNIKPRPLSMPILFTDSTQHSSNSSSSSSSSSILSSRNSFINQPSSPPSPPPPHYHHHLNLSLQENNLKSLDQQHHQVLLKEDSISATKKWQKRRSCIILPREEEGKEHLPDYECTVYKMGKVDVKIEAITHGKKYSKRSWRRLYIELWGTMLRIYPITWLATIGKEPLFVISLAGAEASRAFDYLKKPYVLRLIANDGVQLLIQLTTHKEMISWVENLQAGINISLELDERPMPKFMTLPPRRDNNSNIQSNFSPRILEIERRREQRRRNQQEILA